MPTHLCLTIRFLQPYSHGRGDGGEPEWPPSPLRMFQALVAAAAARQNERTRLEFGAPALHWLERQEPPTIVAAVGVRSAVKYRLYVPDNVADKVAKSWSAGREGSIADFRTEKDVQPTHLMGEAVYYLFPLPDGSCPHLDVLTAAARSITHLGWGVDMVAANAGVVSEKEAARLPGERWRPMQGDSGDGLRVPINGTLNDLATKHTAFLNRLSDDGFKPVPPLSAYRVVGYRRATDAATRPVAAFEIWKPLHEIADLPAGKSRFRPFDAVRRFAYVAGMVRRAAAVAAKQAGWKDDLVASFILGHGDGDSGQATTDDRLMFIPLPSITPLKVESIRRVLVVGPPGSDIARIRQFLSGAELMEEGRPDPVAMLSFIPQSDRNVSHYYTPSARVWSTVTPVVLPGFDDPDGLRKKLNERWNAEVQKKRLDRLDRRTLDLIKRAFKQAGCPTELVEDAELEYREVGFRAGVDLAMRYELPPLKFPRYHIRVRFRHPIQGPLAVGAGRYRGLGVFAADGPG
ncbi:MAG TPA: type I-U CRISPR-associated protein Csb2 [Gemmataceae bacterium]|nr:type I-U CRISPR-associated protein Csb2 [Gemmataceae bacterium]